jgi:hypothetical protein
METGNQNFPIFRRATSPPRPPGGTASLAGPLGLVRSRRNSGLLRLLFWQAAAVGIVMASIVLDAALKPSPGVELAWQIGAFFAALILSWQGLARFIPDLDRRWRVRRRVF